MNEAWGLRLPIWVESDVLTVGITLDAALQGCYAVITGWAHGLKQSTHGSASREMACSRQEHFTLVYVTWGQGSGMGGGQASLGKGCQF